MKVAPYFSLPDQNNIVRSLGDYATKWVLLYFYPKDDTPGCTKEACGFQDITTEYTKNNVIVIGVSADTVPSHKKFADKHHLTFILLSDVSKEVIKAYGAWGEKKFMGKVFQGIKRVSFLIGPDQTIQKEYPQVNVFTHAKEILEDVRTLTSI